MAHCCGIGRTFPVKPEDKVADVVFYGDIVTVAGEDSSLWSQEAVAVRNGKILAVGSRNEIAKYVNSCITVVKQLTGTQTLMPGLVDPHVHWAMGALSYHGSINMFGFEPTTKEEVMESLSAAAASRPEGEWIVGSGLNPMLVPGMSTPTRQELDLLSSKHPIFLLAASMHAAYANTMALTLAGIDKNNPAQDPEGGYIMRDTDGEPTGELKEAGAMQMVMAVATMVDSDATAYTILKKAINDYTRRGVTTLADAGFFDSWENSKAQMKQVASSDRCPVRVVAYNDTLPAQEDRGTPGSDNLVFMGQKFIVDGSPFSATVAVKDPYLDNQWVREQLGFPPGPNLGQLNFTKERFLELARPVHSGRWQLICHAQGETAIDLTLDVMATLQAEDPRTDHRHTIEHASLITQSQIQRAKSMNVELTFLTPQIYFFGYYYKTYIFGEERAKRYHPIASAMKAGIKASFHNDEPCTPTNPLGSLCTAVNRRMRAQAPVLPDFAGVEPLVLGPDERITVDQGLKACTIYPAYQLHHDHLIGSIEPGKLADFVILAENPRKVSQAKIRNISVLETYRKGVKTTLYDV